MTCHRCKGTGWIVTYSNGDDNHDTCPDCNDTAEQFAARQIETNDEEDQKCLPIAS